MWWENSREGVNPKIRRLHNNYFCSIKTPLISEVNNILEIEIRNSTKHGANLKVALAKIGKI